MAPRVAGHCRFNLSLLDRRIFRQQQRRLGQRKLLGAVIGNKCCVRLKDSIMTFTNECSQRLALDKAKKVKSLKNSLSWAEAGVFPRDRFSQVGC